MFADALGVKGGRIRKTQFVISTSEKRKTRTLINSRNVIDILRYQSLQLLTLS